MDDNSITVPERDRPIEQADRMRPKADPEVWTDSMLKALAKGPRGGKWHSLIDKIWRRSTLRQAFERVKANDGAAGVDHQSIEDYERHLENNIQRLSNQLREGTYRPKAVRRTWIPKPGRDEQRPLGIPTVEDRIVQMAALMVVEPVFEHDFADHSYGFRPGRGAKDALRHVHQLLVEGDVWIVDADIKGYFDNIPHDRLIERVNEKISDSRVLELIRMFLEQEVEDDEDRWQPEQGTPQGGVISPLLANIYLDPLDQQMAEQGYQMVRYADDFVIACQTREQAEQALKQIKKWTTENGLTLHPDKTRLVNALGEEGFSFLGYQFKQGIKCPRDKKVKAFRDVIRDKTGRTDGRSLEAIIEDVNEVSRSWFEYFKHSCSWTFSDLDGFVRRRIRAILRHRNNVSGYTNMGDSIRWPNAFFEAKGLFSMEKMVNHLSQSLW